MCAPIAPPVTVCHTVKIGLLFFFNKKISIPRAKMVTRNDKMNTGEGSKAKRAGLSRMMRVGDLRVTRLRSWVWSQLWYVPVWTYLRRPTGTTRNTSLIRWRTNDGIKTIILSSSSGGVAFLTPSTTRGSLLVICQVENTWSGNLTSSGRNGCWGHPFQDGTWRLGHYWTVYNFINDCHSCCETDGGW